MSTRAFASSSSIRPNVISSNLTSFCWLFCWLVVLGEGELDHLMKRLLGTHFYSRQLCCVHICPSDTSHAARGTECAHWVCFLVSFVTWLTILSVSVLSSPHSSWTKNSVTSVDWAVHYVWSALLSSSYTHQKTNLWKLLTKSFIMLSNLVCFVCVTTYAHVTSPLPSTYRFSNVLLHRPRLLPCHDLRCRSPLWSFQPYHLHLHLFCSWFRLRHGYQRLWRCGQTHSERQESIYTPQHIRFWYRGNTMYHCPDELLQQSPGHLLY